MIVLDHPLGSNGAAYPAIAGLGTLGLIAKGDLAKTIFTAVGYGTEISKPLEGPQKPQPMSYPLLRRYVDMPGQKLTPQILQTNGNPNDTRGTGGTCFGGYQRVHIASVANWLATFGL